MESRINNVVLTPGSIATIGNCDIIHAMENEYSENTPSQPEGHVPDTEKPEAPGERLERVEAALKLVLEHMQTSTRGSEMLESQHTRSLLSSIAFGFSAISLIAMWSVDLASEEIDVELLRFTIGMSFLLLASVVDLTSARLLNKAVNRAILEKDPSSLVIWEEGSWQRFFQIGYWIQLKQKSIDFYHYQLARCVALVVYIVAGVFLIWAVFAL